MNKKIIVPVVTAAVVGAAAFGVTRVSAQAIESDSLSIVERIATRFNLNQEDVQAVFEEERTERLAEMQQRMEKRLNEAVAAGELTEEQKQLIQDKHAELRAEMETELELFQNISEEEREAAVQAKHDEMRQRHEELRVWAEENGINMKFLRMVSKFHGGKGHFRFHLSDDGSTQNVMITKTVKE